MANRKFSRRFSNTFYGFQNKEKASMVYFVFCATFGLWYCWFHVMPHYHPDANQFPTHAYLHYVVPPFLYTTIILNLYKIFANPSNVKTNGVASKDDNFLQSVQTTEDGGSGRFENKPDEDSSGSDGSYCNICCVVKPPRSHHCRRCNICILKRDHHCPFSGNCIGYFNQRYYFSMLLYLVVALTYSVLYQFDFLVDRFGHFGYWAPVYLLAPHVFLLLRKISCYEFFLCMVTLKSLSMFLFAWGIFFQHSYLMMRGQTKHESKVKMDSYNKGIMKNVANALGRRWYLAWLCPFIPSELPGDGHYFEENSKII